MTAIFKREFKAYFNTPIGYIVLTAYYLFLGIYFTLIYSYGSPDIQSLILAMVMVVTFTVPVITMRLISEEKRQKSDQLLLTAPVKLNSIVLGKFFAALCVYALGFAPTVIYEIIIMSYVSVNVFSSIYSLFGIILLGSALISVGMFISSLTESAVVSAILTLVTNIFLIYMSSFSSMVKISWLASVFKKASFISAVESFGNNTFSVPDIVYFISITVAFLFLSVRSIEKRRWA